MPRVRDRESQRAAAAAARELDAVEDLLAAQRSALDAVLRKIDARLSAAATSPTSPQSRRSAEPSLEQSRQSPASIQLDSEVMALLSRAADAGLLRGGHELVPLPFSPAPAVDDVAGRLSASIVRLRRLSVRESVASPT